MSNPQLTFRHLAFTGFNVDPAELAFLNGCNLIWGASNTGKSFVLRAFDFMLGSSKQLPGIGEMEGYDYIWLGFSIRDLGDYTLSRSVKGKGFRLYRGLIKSAPEDQFPVKLSSKHEHGNVSTLSGFLLEHLGFGSRQVAKDSSGTQKSLSFRDIARIILVGETSIISEYSPIQGGQHDNSFFENGVFRFLLSGTDDSAIVTVARKKDVKASINTKVELIDEMLTDVNGKIDHDFPSVVELNSQYEKLTASLEEIKVEMDSVQHSIQKLLYKKRTCSSEVSVVCSRIDEINIHLGRFRKLDEVYGSDIGRIEALEEAGFLLSLEGGRSCPLCGAQPQHHQYTQDLSNIKQIEVASSVELEKIKTLRTDLQHTVLGITEEHSKLEADLPDLLDELVRIELEIERYSPQLNNNKNRITEIVDVRDNVRAGLALYEQRAYLLRKRQEAEGTRAPSKEDKPHLELSGALANEFCKTVSDVLAKWGFPGKREVSFDHNNYDLRIDGKLRKDNGKGVRAITHAAFKVALLIFCHERGLPHPGIIVLDTPLLTYRDPIGNHKFGQLAEDEIFLAKTHLKQAFFEHLNSISHLGQFIIFENVNIPDNINDMSHVEVFTGQENGRGGFFPVKR